MATKAELERKIAELQSQLPKEAPVEPSSIDGEHGDLWLYIRDEAFECRRVDVSYQMMLFAQAQRKARVDIPKNMPDGPAKKALEEKRNQAGMTLMDAMLNTVQALLKPRERDRFHDFMMEIGLSDNPLNPGEFQEAIGNVIAAVGGQEGKGKAVQTTASPSFSSSETTSVSYVDFSQDKAGVANKQPANS